MATLRFTKGHGTGNDFVLYADPEGAFELSASQIAELCDRHFGVGADGVIRAVRSAHVAGAGIANAATRQTPAAEWFMDYRNADGSVAEMCGNGIRVYAEFLLASGLARLGEGEVLNIATRAGVKRVRRSALGYEVDMGRWALGGSEPLVRAKGLRGAARPGLGVDVGNPHVVVALPELAELDALELSYPPVLDPEPPAGTNVEFVVPNDPLVQDGVGSIRMRVHERGSGETLSCGTGIVASALATRSWAGNGAPNTWRVEVDGGVCEVRMAPAERGSGVDGTGTAGGASDTDGADTCQAGSDGEHVYLSGPAVLVYDGELVIN